jgi:hypothetical protein
MPDKPAPDAIRGSGIQFSTQFMVDSNGMITTNLVIHETCMLLSRRISRKAARLFLEEVFATILVRRFYSFLLFLHLTHGFH